MKLSDKIEKELWGMFDTVKKDIIRNSQMAGFSCIDNDNMFIIHPKLIDKKKPNLLIVAGVHGDETTGPVAIADFMNEVGKYTRYANLFFMPFVNEKGIRVGLRFDSNGKDPNRAYLPRGPESKGFMKSKIADDLSFFPTALMAKDGFLSLHEFDKFEDDKPFVYAYTQDGKPCPLTYILRDTLFKHHREPYSGDDGIEMNRRDGSLEDYLNYKGVACAFATEVTNTISFTRRVAAYVDVIKEFIKYDRKAR